jgi:hypothetical protein
MGAMPFSDLFKQRRQAADDPAAHASGTASRHFASAPDNAAIVADLERSGTVWFWATNAEGRVSYLSDAILQACELASAEDLSFQALFTPIGRDGDGRSLGLKLGTRKPFTNLLVETTGPDPSRRLVLRLNGRSLFDDSGAFRKTTAARRRLPSSPSSIR